jgi:hypothetical protein
MTTNSAAEVETDLAEVVTLIHASCRRAMRVVTPQAEFYALM